MSIGSYGEEIAATYLEKKGYRIIDRNFRGKTGEIDLIACRERTLVFVEVKTRRNLSYGLPWESITEEKKRHIRSTAALYTQKYKLFNVPQRIDVVEILMNDGRNYVKHIENAF